MSDISIVSIFVGCHAISACFCMSVCVYVEFMERLFQPRFFPYTFLPISTGGDVLFSVLQLLVHIFGIYMYFGHISCSLAADFARL